MGGAAKFISLPVETPTNWKYLYDLNSTISVNAGIRWGLNSPATDIMAITGFSIFFPKTMRKPKSRKGVCL
jgi:hypothetical protein